MYDGGSRAPKCRQGSQEGEVRGRAIRPHEEYAPRPGAHSRNQRNKRCEIQCLRLVKHYCDYPMHNWGRMKLELEF